MSALDPKRTLGALAMIEIKRVMLGSHRRLILAMCRVTSAGVSLSALVLSASAFARGRPLETALEPGLEVRHCGKVHVDRTADDGSDVEIGHREVSAEQILLLGHCRVEHLERRHENLQRLVALGGIALGRRQADGMQRPDVDAAIDLGDRPKAPLPRRRLAFQRAWIEFAIGVLLGEVERDRKRLEQHEAVVHDKGQAPVRIDGEKLRRAGADVPISIGMCS